MLYEGKEIVHTNQATYITQKVADIFPVTSRCSVSTLSGCVFSMRGDFPLLFVKGLCVTNQAECSHKKNRSQVEGVFACQCVNTKSSDRQDKWL